MTPAIDYLKKQQIDFQVHQYEHDKNGESYGLEAVQKLHLDARQVFKTLVVCLDNHQLVVAIIPVAKKLSMKLIAKHFMVKKAMMADKNDVLRSTGYVLGGVSPFAQKKRIVTVLDDSALNFPSIYVSAGKRGVEIELAASKLQQLLNAKCEGITLP
ncbi:Cys-tRNA(Pro) deacylase [Psychromonas sp. MME2]|uniref:Cys-tRNA(Pro) deacylase n=1 Tax=unclassified Psychromonas TaxID=2614957 RepID=UPI00339C9118